MTVLSVRDLALTIGDTPILHDIDLEVKAGEILGIVGESGSGKSLTALSIMQLLPRASRWTGGIEVAGNDVGKMSEKALCSMRGRDVAMIFQEPMTALNPVHTIGHQIAETILIHGECSRRQAGERAAALMNRVGLDPERISPNRYPHELSGGQRQRVAIAMAIALRPKLLIADEPTTALDVTTQAQILDLLRSLVRQDRMGLVFITHDLAVISNLADRIAVMREGRVVEAARHRRGIPRDAPSLYQGALLRLHPRAGPLAGDQAAGRACSGCPRRGAGISPPAPQPVSGGESVPRRRRRIARYPLR